MNALQAIFRSLACLLLVGICGQSASAVDFAREIQPLIESACLNCHNEKKAEGGLRLDTRKGALTGGDNGEAIVPGRPADSPFYALTILAADDDEVMPPEKEGPLAKSQIERLKKWIAEGAKWPESAKLKLRPRIDFVQHVKPILQQNCLACHQKKNAEGELDLSTHKTALVGGENGPVIVAFRPLTSKLYTATIADEDADELMPPADKGGPMTASQTGRLREWIAQGAIWPRGVTLRPQAKAGVTPTTDTRELIAKIHARIVKRSKQDAAKKPADYSSKVPLTGATYQMVAIKGGEFLMGSPAGEANRQKIEGPQVKVKIAPFWIGKTEVTWDEYEPFMITQAPREKHGGRKDFDPKKHTLLDAISQPTKPYMEMSFGMGQEGYPAISMTQHAASKYCQWLSAQTGHFYRLPTEAEWEYACRAGTTTAYSFGDDAAKIGEYAWYYENSNEKYQKVGVKKPNPWGLHDMHGNVTEWTVDQFSADYFTRIKDGAANPLLRPERLYPRSVRGGHWDDDAEQLRSAQRRGSAAAWKMSDPQLPKSIWYHTNARWLGFRIVRPAKVPSAEEMYFYWNSAAGKL